jgi:hypothetical protein
MEPDFYQYAGSDQQTAPWTYAQAGQIMSQLVNAVKPYLPNAAFSMDISPWVATNDNTGGDGADNGKNWYSYFDMSLFTFTNTSGPDPAWDSATNINARMNDGVISTIQYNPSSSWGSTISAVQPQLNTPRTCP